MCFFHQIGIVTGTTHMQQLLDSSSASSPFLPIQCADRHTQTIAWIPWKPSRCRCCHCCSCAKSRFCSMPLWRTIVLKRVWFCSKSLVWRDFGPLDPLKIAFLHTPFCVQLRNIEKSPSVVSNKAAFPQRLELEMSLWVVFVALQCFYSSKSYCVGARSKQNW